MALTAVVQNEFFLDHLNDRLAASGDQPVTSPSNREVYDRKGFETRPGVHGGPLAQ